MPSEMERIAAAVYGHESSLNLSADDPHVYAEDEPLRWMVLTQDLAAASTSSSGSSSGSYSLTTPTVATANPAIFQASANGGRGGYAIDTTLTYYVQEGTGKASYSAGQWLLCRPIATQGGVIWESVALSEDIIQAQLTADWYACCNATCELLIASGGIPSSSGTCISYNTGYTLTAYDPLNKITKDPNAVLDTFSGQYYIPSGNTVILKRFSDANDWQPISFGGSICSVCCGSSSGSSGSSSSSSSGCNGPAVSAILATAPGYNAGATNGQVLGQVNGCYQWINLNPCPSSSSGG